MPSIADAKEFQFYENERIKRAIDLIKRNNMQWIFDYSNQVFEEGAFFVFHGTHLSNVTSIRYDGLFPMREKKFTEGNIFVVTNPVAAASHILKGGQFDTYNDGEEPDFPEIDPEEKIKMDPLILLKIDIEQLSRDEDIDPEVMQKLRTSWERESNYVKEKRIKIDRFGVGMQLGNIKSKYIKAVIHDKQGKIHEVSLDDLIDRVILKNELGIYPDFLD